MVKTDRRNFIRHSALAATGTMLAAGCAAPRAEENSSQQNVHRNRIGVSTYSFWQFNGPKESVPIEDCIEKAAGMGFDGIEFLLVQM